MQNNYIQKLQPVNHDHTLDEVTQFAKSLGIKTFDFPDDMAMKDYRSSIEKKIVDTVHPYKIYENKKVPGQWATYIYDRFRKGKRRNIRRRNYDELIHALTEYYINNYDINITMQYLFEKWLIFRRDETPVKPGTIRKDLSTWNTYCKNVKLDDKSLSDIRVSEVSQKYLARFFRNLTKRRQFTKQAVNNIRSIFSGMLSYAVELELIEHNPIHDVDFKRLPFKPVPDKQEDVFTREEAYKLLTYLEPLDDPYALAIRLDFNLFIRIGELAGLKWENIDFNKRTVYICHQITYEPELDDELNLTEKKMVTENYLKGCTSQGFRTEHMRDKAIEILKRAKEINPDGEFVFMPNGKPIITLTFNKRLKKYCEEVGIPYHSSHKIRFYACSTAYNGENLPQLSRMMGHSQVSTTLHYLRNVDKENTFADVFKNLGNSH